MTETLKHFGTDGIRGLALDGDLSLDHVTRWGRAWAQVAAAKGVASMVMGWDPRLSSEPLAQAFLAGWGQAIPVTLLGVVPTPAVAWITSRRSRAWGLMISASHNPPEDNGLKGFDSEGNKLSESLEKAVETAFAAATAVPPLLTLPPLDPRDMEAYLDHLGALTVSTGMRLGVDCAHGATAPWAERLLGPAVTHWIGRPADGARINVGVGSTHLERLQAAIQAGHADLGIAFDGDGDRCLLVAPDGGVVDGDQLVWLLTQHELTCGRHVPGVVGTVMTNAGLEAALVQAGIPFLRTPVGDKFMVRALAQKGWSLAAEASGHVIQKAIGPSGDGLATALNCLKALAALPPETRWTWRFRPWPLGLLNLDAPARKPLEACHHLLETQRRLQEAHGTEIRQVLRWSGTEPKLRLMVEAVSERLVEQGLAELRAAAEKDLATR